MQYMLLIYAEEQTADEAAGPAEQPISAPWLAYTQWLIEQGIHRGGERLASSQASTTVRVRDGRRLITDGPFAETREVLGGYYVVECDGLDAALEAAARCPGAAYGSIEVRPLVLMPPDAGVASAAAGSSAAD